MTQEDVKVMFLGRTHPFYHGFVLAIALYVAYKVSRL